MNLPWSLFEHIVGNGMTMVPMSRQEPIDLTSWLRAQTDPKELHQAIPEMPGVPSQLLRKWLEAGRAAVALIEKLGSDGSAQSWFPDYPLDPPG